MIIADLVISPSGVKCRATLNNLTLEVTGQCEWEYAGDLSMVDLFHVKLHHKRGKEMADLWVHPTNKNVMFNFNSSNISQSYKATITVLDRCKRDHSMKKGIARFETGKACV